MPDYADVLLDRPNGAVNDRADLLQIGEWASCPRHMQSGMPCQDTADRVSRSEPGRNFFVADIFGATPKGDVASMEHPLFALQANDRQVKVYRHNNCTVTVSPGRGGCATIHDKDLWIYCISQLVAAMNRGSSVSRVVRFKVCDFLRATNRGTSGRDYERVTEMLRRLSETRVETSIKTEGRCEIGFWGLVSHAEMIVPQGHENMTAIEVELPAWLFGSIEAMKVKTLSPAYFQLRKPIERRIYEIARKHCGEQPIWRISLAVLHVKSGSRSPLRNFRQDVRKLAESGRLPDYLMAYDRARDIITFYGNGPKGRQAEARDMVAGRPHAPIAAHEALHHRKARKTGRS